MKLYPAIDTGDEGSIMVVTSPPVRYHRNLSRLRDHTVLTKHPEKQKEKSTKNINMIMKSNFFST